jgi:hypothetical protein
MFMNELMGIWEALMTIYIMIPMYFHVAVAAHAYTRDVLQ